jgi:Ca2+-binding EF-hand superfamily protein
LEKKELLEMHDDLVKERITGCTVEVVLQGLDMDRDGKLTFAEYSRFMLSR